MTNFLIELLLPLTLLLATLLLVRKYIVQHLGVEVSYKFWIIVPVGLLCYLVPLPWQPVDIITASQIQHYIITPAKQLKQPLNSSWMMWTWLVCSFSILFIGLISHLRFTKKLKLTAVDDDLIKIKTPAALVVFKSAQTYSPMLIGLINQKLVIPENFAHIYNQDQQNLILEHEICHFDRHDIYWNFIALTCVALFWFHPLVWIAYFAFRQDQELSCDQVVLARKQLSSKINYSKALLVTAEHAPPLAFAQLSFAHFYFNQYGDKQMMFERIKQIKINKQATKLGMAVVVATSVTMLSALSYAGNLGSDAAKKYRTAPKAIESVIPVHRVEPKYPLKAATENIEGSVVLKFDVNANGNVDNVEVVKGMPAYVFDRVAVTALKQWKYKTSTKGASNNLVQLDFRLDEDSALESANLIEKIKVIQ